MSDCDRYRPQLVAYSDGDLSPDDSRDIAAHLSECESCRADLNELEASFASVRTAFESVPEVARYRAWPTIETIAKRRAYRRQVAVLTAGLAVCLLVAAGWLLTAAEISEAPGQARTAALDPSSPTSDTADPVAAAEVEKELDALRARVAAFEAKMKSDREPTASTWQRRAPSAAALTGLYAREEIAAITLQAGIAWEETYGNNTEAKRRFDYVLTHYADTAAASAARKQLETDNGNSG